MESKYIVGRLKASTLGMVGAVVFPDICDHAQMARLNLIDGEALSAGFCSIVDNQVELYGRSVSLKIDANPEHKRYVSRALGLS